MEKRDGGEGSFFTGAFLGAIIGAGLAFFLFSDEKTKKKLKRKGETALDNLGDLVAELEEKGREFSQKAQKVKADLEEKVERGELGQEVQEKLAHIDQLRERGRKATGRFFTRSGKKLS
jgi:gas vesicle protein